MTAAESFTTAPEPFVRSRKQGTTSAASFVRSSKESTTSAKSFVRFRNESMTSAKSFARSRKSSTTSANGPSNFPQGNSGNFYRSGWIGFAGSPGCSHTEALWFVSKRSPRWTVTLVCAWEPSALMFATSFTVIPPMVVVRVSGCPG